MVLTGISMRTEGETAPSNRHKGCANSAPYIYIASPFDQNRLIGKALRGRRGCYSEPSPPPKLEPCACLQVNNSLLLTQKTQVHSQPQAVVEFQCSQNEALHQCVTHDYIAVWACKTWEIVIGRQMQCHMYLNISHITMADHKYSVARQLLPSRMNSFLACDRAWSGLRLKRCHSLSWLV